MPFVEPCWLLHMPPSSVQWLLSTPENFPMERGVYSFLYISGNMVCSSGVGEGGWCFRRMFLSVGGGYDPLTD